jgi:transposase-like protein
MRLPWVLDFLVQRKRDAKAATKLMRKLLKKQGFAPTWIGFKRPGSTQRFLSAHAAVYNCFNFQRHPISKRTLRIFRNAAFPEWRFAVQTVFPR